jgi:hypothetical protein
MTKGRWVVLLIRGIPQLSFRALAYSTQETQIPGELQTALGMDRNWQGYNLAYIFLLGYK